MLNTPGVTTLSTTTTTTPERSLYIAYYTRLPTSTRDPHRYHSGLLAFRKDNPNAGGTVFHATTSPGSPWQFEAKHVTAPRTIRLVCLLYIGKLDHEVTDDLLADLLASQVSVNNADPDWNCLNWVYDAVTVLVSTKVLQPLPCSPAKLWETGARYADHWRKTQNNNRQFVGTGTPIPCCDALGNPLPSPL